MSKRRSRKKSNKPNIPQSTLERARKQAAGELPEDAGEDVELDEETLEEEAQQPTDETPVAEADDTTPEETDDDETAAEDERRSTKSARKPRRARRRRSNASRVSQAQIRRSKQKGELDQETIEYMLAHPEKEVSEEELHEEYGYVLRDLRNMGVLAAILLVVLVAMAQLL